ncbi:MAG: hypothetical protein KDD35_04650 [Bdellovibrionales bacterium]|nr:hypothetical protein [Bdellovibrionales bacterium]
MRINLLIGAIFILALLLSSCEEPKSAIHQTKKPSDPSFESRDDLSPQPNLNSNPSIFPTSGSSGSEDSFKSIPQTDISVGENKGEDQVNELPTDQIDSPELEQKDSSYLKILGPVGELDFDEVVLSKMSFGLRDLYENREFYQQRWYWLLTRAENSLQPPKVIEEERIELKINIITGQLNLSHLYFLAIRGGPGIPFLGYGTSQNECAANEALLPAELGELKAELFALTLCEGYKSLSSKQGVGFGIKIPNGTDVEVDHFHMLGIFDEGTKVISNDFKQIYYFDYVHKMICGNNALFAQIIDKVLKKPNLKECAEQSWYQLQKNDFNEGWSERSE